MQYQCLSGDSLEAARVGSRAAQPDSPSIVARELSSAPFPVRRAHPFNAVALTNLGLFAADVLRKPSDAEALHRRAVAIDPSNAPALYNLGALLGEQGGDGHQEAMELYRRAVEAQPDHAFALFNLAVGLEEEGDLEGARTVS